MTGEQARSFTVRAPGLLGVLLTDCHICTAFDHRAPPAVIPAFLPFHGIWDTGATMSAITQDVVSQCGLKPIGMTKVHGVAGITDTELYLVNLRLPQGVAFSNVTVTRAILSPGAHVLIGMDVISGGDFSITSNGGKTIFSFRVPSLHQTDFVAEDHRRMKVPKTFGGMSGGNVKGRRHK